MSTQLEQIVVKMLALLERHETKTTALEREVAALKAENAILRKSSDELYEAMDTMADRVNALDSVPESDEYSGYRFFNENSLREDGRLDIDRESVKVIPLRSAGAN